MSRHLKHRPLKADTILGKAWERKQEKQEYQTEKWYSGYSSRPRKPKVELLEVIAHGPHRLQLVTHHTCIMFINTPGFKLPIEPEGKMLSISRINTPIGAEYTVTFAGEKEWEYLKAVFAAFAFMGKI